MHPARSIVPTHPGPPLPAGSAISRFVEALRLRRVLVGAAIKIASGLCLLAGRPTPRIWLLREPHPELLVLSGRDLVVTTGLLDRPERLEGAMALALCRPLPGAVATARSRLGAWLGWRLAQLGGQVLAFPQLGRLAGRLLRGRGAAGVASVAADRRAVQLVGPAAVRRALRGITPRPVGGRLAALGPCRVLGGPEAVPGGPPPNWLRIVRLFGRGRVLPFPHADVSAHLVPVDG